MTISKKRIAVLFHKSDRHYDPSRYIVHHLAECWREDGHDVTYLFGTRRFVPADIILVHVNLSIVPEAYLEFASRYPIALNNRVRDIRKSTISQNLVRPGDGWDGPVIIKSDLNFAGLPERVLQRTWVERRWRRSRRVRRLIERMMGRTAPFSETTDYQIYKKLSAVPARLVNHPKVVVEKFRPEIEDGRYHSRVYQFLGDRWTCTRMASAHAIVKTAGCVRTENVEPHEAAVAWRKKLELDYGKLDYVVCEGEVVLLDANKTTGAAIYSKHSHYMSKERLESQRRHRAEGLYSYFKE